MTQRERKRLIRVEKKLYYIYNNGYGLQSTNSAFAAQQALSEINTILSLKGGEWPCPYCEKTIDKNLEKCPHCGVGLKRAPVVFRAEAPKEQ